MIRIWEQDNKKEKIYIIGGLPSPRDCHPPGTAIPQGLVLKDQSPCQSEQLRWGECSHDNIMLLFSCYLCLALTMAVLSLWFIGEWGNGETALLNLTILYLLCCTTWTWHPEKREVKWRYLCTILNFNEGSDVLIPRREAVENVCVAEPRGVLATHRQHTIHPAMPPHPIDTHSAVCSCLLRLLLK